MIQKSFLSKPARLVGMYLMTAVFLSFTDPLRMPSFFLVVPFGLLFCSLYLTIVMALDFFRSPEDERVIGMKLQRPRLLATVIAGFPVILLVLQSIVQLTLWDVILALTIFLLIYVYVSRSDVHFFSR